MTTSGAAQEEMTKGQQDTSGYVAVVSGKLTVVGMKAVLKAFEKEDEKFSRRDRRIKCRKSHVRFWVTKDQYEVVRKLEWYFERDEIVTESGLKLVDLLGKGRGKFDFRPVQEKK